jgi:hypothetical protein
MTSITTEHYTCPRCTDTATIICTSCKNISYCSPECQQADWLVHQSVCEVFQAFSTAPRPAPNMRKVIVFLPGNMEPQLLWAPVRDGSNGGETMWPADFVEDPKHVSWTPIETLKNGWTDMDLGYAMQVFHDDGFLSKYPRGDPALFAATQGLDAAGWCGPIMVCCQSLPDAQYANQENTHEGVEILDMDALAFSHLASFLVDYSNEDLKHLYRKGPKVQCVEVSCGQAGQSAQNYRDIQLPGTHPLHQSACVFSRVSQASPSHDR